jgi:hypothetical protein
MDPSLSPDQYRALREAIRGRMNYLHGCRVRMYRLGAKDGDPLFDLFGEAEAAIRCLVDELHNRSIPSGGRRPWEPGGPGHHSN